MKLTKRKHIRLENYDYSTEGAYFVTVCVKSQQTPLCAISGTPDTPDIHLTHAGSLILKVWHSLRERFPAVTLDEFIVMPDHVHGVLFLNSESGKSTSLGKVIGAFKSLSTLAVNRSLNRSGALWQRGYYDRVIRNSKELGEIRKYICDNPVRLLLLQSKQLP